MATDLVLEKQIAELQEKITRREADLQLWKGQLKTLEDARVILIGMISPVESGRGLQPVVVAEKERGLQEVVLEYLQKSPEPGGVTIKQVTDDLEEAFGPRYNGRNSYASSVYVTLKRLVEQGKANTVLRDGQPKRWVAADGTVAMFLAHPGRKTA